MNDEGTHSLRRVVIQPTPQGFIVQIGDQMHRCALDPLQLLNLGLQFGQCASEAIRILATQQVEIERAAAEAVNGSPH